MNYLAHLRLAPDEPLLRIGNLLGDFARGVDVAALPEPLRRGIAQHRAIDRFTDTHAVFRQSRARLSPSVSRFGGVLVDVFYDHFLARQWHRFGDGGPLVAFAQGVYRELRQYDAWLPLRLRQAAPMMRRLDWLGGYRELANIDATLRRMGERLRRDNPLARGGDELRRHYEGLEDDFAAFFPEVLAHAKDVVHGLSN